MMLAQTIRLQSKRPTLLFYFSLFFFCIHSSAGAQSLSVSVVQNMNFGAFLQGSSGGTISIATDGTRSSTGDVIPMSLNTSYTQAIFEIEAPYGTVISILYGPNATLTGNNGGYMTLHIDGSDPASPLITTVSYPYRTRIYIGGTLYVGNAYASKPGIYTGTFSITFNQE